MNVPLKNQSNVYFQKLSCLFELINEKMHHKYKPCENSRDLDIAPAGKRKPPAMITGGKNINRQQKSQLQEFFDDVLTARDKLHVAQKNR